MYNENSDRYEAGKVVAALDKNLDPSLSLEHNIGNLLNGIDYEKVEVIFHSKKNMKNSSAGDILLIYLKNKDKVAVLDAVEKLSANPYIEYAEPDYIEELHVVSNDPLFNQLWGIKKIKTPLAWNYTTGNRSVAVGIIDSGIDNHHPDIKANMWVSENRKIENGWNFAEDNLNSLDTNGHGTHVAGTVGAVGNNHIGITGVCWDVEVVSMKFGLDTASAIAAIDFSNYFNIPILNASWGGRRYSYALKQAIDEYDGLFIASAGNDGTNNDLDPVYPAAYESDNIIAVAATDPEDALADFSNFGIKSVDIGAPGTNILSLGLEGEYTPKNGTSMAAPHVAGAAALLKSYYPHISTAMMKAIILSSAEKKPELNGKVVTGGLLDTHAMFELARYLQQNNKL
ncbi:MAG: S8 family peptidase [Beduini sp.]|uniref:S8 family peptidase n=1 Tax=Beduini sp. TaxID=1922300 RepID=UPI00399F3B4D